MRSDFARAREQLDRLRQEDPAGWATDRDESRSWQTGTDRDTLTADDEADWWR